MIAECLGIPVPDFMGKGGLPFNVEWLCRELELKYRKDINLFEWPFATDHIIDLLDEVEEYWERGKGAPPKKDALYHNLAVWGFGAGECRSGLRGRIDYEKRQPRLDR